MGCHVVALGLFDDPYRSLDLTREASAHFSIAHDELALTAARKSVVMLKNELVNSSSVLPLQKTGQKIALIGWWANDKLNAEGCGVIWGNHSFAVTLRDGIAAAMKDATKELKTIEGSLIEAPISGGIADATAAAEWADVVVLALGEPKNYSGEAESRTDIVIPQPQQALAEAVSAAGKPTVVLLKNGRALALEGAVKNAQAIMVTWFLGKKTGEALADLLFGDHSPEGRLPVSFPVRSGQQPYHYNHASSGRPCVGDSPPSARGRAFKNCWREIANSALYPFVSALLFNKYRTQSTLLSSTELGSLSVTVFLAFHQQGHGLTYSSFAYGKPEFSNGGKMAWDGTIEITTKVTNTGAREATETVQLYVHDVVASRVRPVRELKGFEKISLAPGASMAVQFKLDRAMVSFAAVARASIDANGPDTTVEPGMFDVWVAPSATTGGNATQFELLPPSKSV
jgi:beta-glucosidase